ncbi:MAG: hypothetical protein ACJAX2_002719 [Celeribacter sp.]|jgi:hypothetical protein
MKLYLYRLFTYRRMILCCAVLPILSALVFGVNPLWVGVFCVICVALTMVIWPSSMVEPLAFSLTVALLVGVFAGHDTLSQMAKTPNAMPFFWGSVAIAAFFFWLFLVGLLCKLEMISAGRRKQHLTMTVPLELADAIAMSDGFFDGAARRAGPPCADGRIPVTMQSHGLDEALGPQITETTYFVKNSPVDQTDADFEQITETHLSFQGRDRVSVQRTRFYAKGTQTKIVKDEVHDMFSVLAWVLYWLKDGAREYMQFEIDCYLKRPTLSNFHVLDKQLIVAIGRVFQSQNESGTPPI